MAKKTGSVRTAVPRSRLRQGGHTTTDARIGYSPGRIESEKPFSLKAQQREAVLMILPKKPATTIFPSDSDSKDFLQAYVTGPYWSDAMRAYRVEFRQAHKRWPVRNRESSFYCSEEADARRLCEAARVEGTWKEWLLLRSLAVKLAIGRKDGFLYRVMAGSVETFIQQPEK